jgi:mono/diheme cytochrome c family protein
MQRVKRAAHPYCAPLLQALLRSAATTARHAAAAWARKVQGAGMGKWPWIVGSVAVAFGAAAAGAFVAFGLYDVAANTPHTQPVYSLLETVKQQSVRRQARHVAVPPLDDAALQARGAACYRDHCLQCHGAPGHAPSPIGLSMQPLPGPLADATRHWSAAEIYWITRNGIKMTGMPAWQHRLQDEDLWAVVAFVQTLPQLGPAQMRARWQKLQTEDCAQPPSDSAAAGDAARGKQALTQYGCHGCHRIDGIVGPETNVGPPLHDFGRRLTLPGAQPQTQAQLVLWLRQPQALHPQTAMPALGVSERDARDIAAYLGNLR